MMRSKLITLIVVLAACGGAQPSTTQRINYPGGGPHFEYELRDGVPNGVGRVWHTNGELRSQGEYVNGAKHGKFTFFTDDGDLEYQALFWNNVEVWRSTSASDSPPAELVESLMATGRSR